MTTQAEKVAELLLGHNWPDYPADELPTIPPAFDHYWSAMYPMWTAPAFKLGLIVEYPDPANRELEGEPRFAAYRDGPEEGDTPTDLVSSDNWGEILACLIGERFADRMREDMTAEQWEEMRRRNTEYDDSACASHDFRDSNMDMAAAFADIMGRDPFGSWETAPDGSAIDPWAEAQATADSILWNAAWNYAKPRYLTATKEG